MRFTKKDTIKLVECYGRAFYNPSLTGKSKLNLLKIIKSENFPNASIEELAEKFDFLFKKYQSFKSGSEKKFEFFTNVDKAVKLAHNDNMPKPFAGIEILTDDDDEEYIPQKDPGVENPIIETNKRRNDEEIQIGAKKVKLDVNYFPIQSHVIPIVPQTNEIQCVKIDDSVLRGIELNVTNAVLDSLKKLNDDKAQLLSDSFQSMKNEIRSFIQNGTTEVILTMHKKDKEHRLNEVYVMMKTLLDEQLEANETLKELKTILKSIIAGQKVQHDTDTKRRELEKNNEVLLKEILSIIKENNTSEN